MQHNSATITTPTSIATTTITNNNNTTTTTTIPCQASASRLQPVQDTDLASLFAWKAYSKTSAHKDTCLRTS